MMSAPASFVTPQPCSSSLGVETPCLISRSSICSDEWTLAIKRSCLNLSVMEPCVTKAAAHLEELKDMVKLHQQSSTKFRKSMSQSPRKKLVRVKSGEFMVVKESSPELKVQGVSIGTPSETSPSTPDEEVCATQVRRTLTTVVFIKLVNREYKLYEPCTCHKKCLHAN